MADKTTGPVSHLAVITVLSSTATFPKPRPPGEPGEPPSGGRPDHTLPGDLPRPEHPIFLPLPPGTPVDPDYGISIERPDHTLPGDQPKPDQGLPGAQPHPEHPIVLPPDSGGWLPIYIWGGGNVPMPTPPIEIPPEGEEPEQPIEWKAAWTATTGWIIVGVPSGPAPAPSKRKR